MPTTARLKFTFSSIFEYLRSVLNNLSARGLKTTFCWIVNFWIRARLGYFNISFCISAKLWVFLACFVACIYQSKIWRKNGKFYDFSRFTECSKPLEISCTFWCLCSVRVKFYNTATLQVFSYYTGKKQSPRRKLCTWRLYETVCLLRK